MRRVGEVQRVGYDGFMPFTVIVKNNVSLVSIGREVDIHATEDLNLLGATITTQRLKFDCGAISRISSSGITAWIRGLPSLGNRVFSFVNCTEQILDAILMIPQFTGSGWVESVSIQLSCDGCQHRDGRIFQALQGHMPKLAVPGICPKCAGHLDFGVDLTSNLESLDERGVFKPRTLSET